MSLAFLVALERLTPDERAVLVLREAFDYGFDEIADVVGKDPANCRQILSRARRRVADDRRRFDPDPDEGRALALRFLEAAREGDMDRLVAMLAPDAVLVGDGGGKARSIGVPMVGAAQVGRALATFYRMGEDWGVTLRPAVVNGGPGFRSFDGEGRLVNVVGFEIQGGVITRVHSMLNPDKLGHLGPLSDLGLRPAAGMSARGPDSTDVGVGDRPSFGTIGSQPLQETRMPRTSRAIRWLVAAAISATVALTLAAPSHAAGPTARAAIVGGQPAASGGYIAALLKSAPRSRWGRPTSTSSSAGDR